MKFKDFVDSSAYLWNNYFSKLDNDISKGAVVLGTGKLLYPNLALFTETNDHFLLELLGADSHFNGLKLFTQKYPSTSQYFTQFEGQQENPIFELGGRNSVIHTLMLSNDVDLLAVKERFGFIADQLTSHLLRKGENGALFSFLEKFQSFHIDNCILINRLHNFYRVKYVLYAEIVSKNFPEEEHAKDLSVLLSKTAHSTQELFGVHYTVDSHYQSYALSGQFANVFLIPKLRETRIGEFLRKHPSFINGAFGCKSHLYNKQFAWIEGNPNLNEKSIQPDLMLENENGYYDICDLKTALLSNKTMTKGGHRRRRFIDYVDEGIAQLANYENYFQFKKNAEMALSKYGVKVNNPRLILVVGNYENASIEEIKEAIRKLKPNYQIIDYDTLNSLYLQRRKAKSNLPTNQ